MKDFLEMMQSRYTTKEYDPSVRLSEEQINTLSEILRLAPSSINSQPWAFRIVSDRDELARLAEHSHFNAPKILAASHVIALCVYTDAETFERERLPKMDERVNAFYAQSLKPRGQAHVQCWMERQVYIALGFLIAAAGAMGVDSTAMEGIDTAAYADVLGLDKKYRVLVAVALGGRSSQDVNQPHLTPKTRRTDVIL